MDGQTRQNFKGEAMDAEVSVDWRGRACKPNKHGGMRAAVFVLGIQAFEIMAIAAVGNNLITYVFNEMHYPLSKSANIVTNFIGTVFLLSLLGGFLSDSYLGSFWTMLIFGFVELSGFILLSVQAHLPQLRPPQCNMLSKEVQCPEASGLKALIFFIALYLVALGSGCLKPNMISHGADQFRKDDPKQSKKLSTYFNTAYFSFCVGELIALTVLVYVQTRSGMDVGFGVSAAAMTLGLMCLVSGAVFYRNKPPQGSIFSPIAKVPRQGVHPDQQSQHKKGGEPMAAVHSDTSGASEDPPVRRPDLRLHHHLQHHPRPTPDLLGPTRVAMDTRLTPTFSIPPASLQSIPYLLMLLLVPLYETAFVPLARCLTGNPSGISPLQRVGVGLFTVTFSMVSAALVERKRRNSHHPISIFWITPQFLIFGVSEMFTAVGLIEFFYKQSLAGMQSFLTAMTYCSYSFGFYLSSVLVALVNRVTSGGGDGDGGWLGENDLNKDRLDLFYWVLAGLSVLNFFNYLFWSRWYSYNPSLSPNPASVGDYADNEPV
ncbi:putative peptide/nitrate transporter [Acorus calamus]|uniref:Peptide/nitrate transporter n=1 Tax=Acorus calamus TaxID=4465 RepID=A0AAV9CI75_ACOCL|nr:putative peptide/nitrate transporter [Acorus calamus]